jgi:hypothetical protein
VLTGAHVLIMSSNPEADAAFLRDVLELPHVDAGEGFLIFGLPPAEVAMHQAEPQGTGKHELFLICDDIHAFVAKMSERSVTCEPPAERGWGTVSSVALPSGLKLGVYEAHHPRPAAKKKAAKALRDVAKAVRKATKKAAKVTKKAAKVTKGRKR